VTSRPSHTTLTVLTAINESWLNILLSLPCREFPLELEHDTTDTFHPDAKLDVNGFQTRLDRGHLFTGKVEGKVNIAVGLMYTSRDDY